MLAAAPADAQASGTIPAADTTPRVPDIVVTGDRQASLDDPAPLLTLHRSDIRALGADTVADVLKALSATTSPGDRDAVLLLNGRRVSGPAEVQSLPAEAIVRMEVLSEQAALKYGYPAGQRVVNFITLPHFVSRKMAASDGTTSGGGGQEPTIAINYTKLNDSWRMTIGVAYEEKGAIRESQRGIVSPMSALPFSVAGNVTSTIGGSIDPALDALVGQSVTVAGVPSTTPALADFARTANISNLADLSRFRTLQPATRKVRIETIVDDRIFGSVHASFSASLILTRSRALQGLAAATFTVPAANSFSPFADNVTLYRYISEAGPLTQTSEGTTAHVGASFSGGFRHWNWSLTASYDRATSRTSSLRGFDLSAARTALSINNADINPFAPVPGHLIGPAIFDSGVSLSNTATATATLDGTLFRLPAGRVSTNLAITAEASRLNATSVTEGLVLSDSLPRDTISARLNINIPVTSRSEHVLGALGDIYGNLNLGVSQVSQFRTLTDVGYGGFWMPRSRWFQANIRFSFQQIAPSAAQIVSPTIATPNLPIFDFTRGQTVQAISLAGGNPDLAPTHRQTRSIGLNLSPFSNAIFQVNVSYETSRERGIVSTLPAVTMAIETAFPDRFVRDVGGALVSIDTRPINLDREDKQQVSTTLFYSKAIGARAPHDPISGATANDTERAGQILLILTHTWRLQDIVVLRGGLPQLNLLGGDVIGGNGGQPRHMVTAQANRSMRGVGLELSGKWQSATRSKAEGAVGDLNFSSLFTVDARAFLDIDEFPAFASRPWAKGLRVTLAVTNAFDQRVTVRNGLGETPSGFQRGYLDPVGRFVSLSLRKLF